MTLFAPPRAVLLAVLAACGLGLASCSAMPLESASGTADAGPFTHPINHAANAPLVALNAESGRLHYRLYAERGAASARNIVPDFSRAGYRGGGVALPRRDSIAVRETLSPGTGGDDHARIQAAIDAVSALRPDSRGLRGAVLLKRGRYIVSQTLVIRAGGVVLRGEGRGGDGTVLRSTVGGNQGRIVAVGADEPEAPQAAPQPRRTRIAADHVPVGATRIRLESASGYRAGDAIAIVREPNDIWLGPDGLDTARYGWTAADYTMYYERKVMAVDGNTLTLDAPIVDAIDARFGGGSVYRTATRRIAQTGIEDLRLEGDPDTGTANSTPGMGPYTAIRFAGVRDSWVRNVAMRYVSHGLGTGSGAHFNSFEDLAYLDPRYGATQGGRRYAFHYEGNSAFNLTQRCYAEGGRHSFMTGQQVPGPNVFLDCVAAHESNDSGPHHRWATGTLYDNIRGYMLRVQNRRTSGTGHGWAGAQQMFWNSSHELYKVQAPPHAMNWAVGQTGREAATQWPPDEPAGIVESAGRPVPPRSLYLQQLRDRLGEQAVIAITTPAQREGRIWDRLSADAGK